MGNNKSKFPVITYQCPNCKQECVSSKKINIKPVEKFIDSRSGEEHIHDSNQGFITIICKKGHRSEHQYFAKCWCGWNNDNNK